MEDDVLIPRHVLDEALILDIAVDETELFKLLLGQILQVPDALLRGVAEKCSDLCSFVKEGLHKVTSDESTRT